MRNGIRRCGRREPAAEASRRVWRAGGRGEPARVASRWQRRAGGCLTSNRMTGVDWLIVAVTALLALYGYMQGVIVGVLSLVGFALCLVPLSVSAQDVALQVNADPIKVNLEKQVGKRVKLRLISGQDVEGTVVAVGTAGVHVAKLAGMDFFDAVVRLDQIAAVVIKVR